MIRELQTLRAISVIAVIIYHYNQNLLPGGYLGVDCFFIISGYIITLTSLKERNKGTFTAQKFYLKRFSRIVPALLLMAVTVTIYSFLLYPYGLYELTSETLPYTILQVANFKFLNGTSYFAPASHLNPLLHTWSLGVEQQFYLFFPILFGLLSKWSGRAQIQALSTIFLSSIVLQIASSDRHEFYNPACRAWLFIVGAFWATKPFKWPSILGSKYTGHLGLWVGFWCLSNDIHATATSAWICIFTCIVIGKNSSNQPASQPATILSAIGDRSYSLYLWHWPVMTMYPEGQNKALEILGIAATVIILSELSYRIVEFYPRKLNKASKVTATSITVYTGLIIAGILAFNTPQPPSPFEEWKKEKGVLFDFKKHGELTDIEHALNNSQAEAILIGDSHAQIYLQPFLDYCEANKLTLTTHVSSSFYSFGKRNFQAILKSNQSTKEFDQSTTVRLLHDKLLNDDTIQYIFIAQRFDCFLRHNNPHDSYTHLSFSRMKSPEKAVTENYAIIAEDLGQLLQNLTSKNKKVILLGQVPSQVEDPRDKPGVSTFQSPEFYSGEKELIQQLKDAGLKFIYYNPRRDLESTWESEAWKYYRDDDHLNLKGIEVLSEKLGSYLNSYSCLNRK